MTRKTKCLNLLQPLFFFFFLLSYHFYLKVVSKLSWESAGFFCWFLRWILLSQWSSLGSEITNAFCHYRREAKCCAAPNEFWLNIGGSQTGGSLTDSKAIEENSLHTSAKDFFCFFFPFFFSNGSGGEKSGREAERKCVKQSEPLWWASSNQTPTGGNHRQMRCNHWGI